MALAIDSADQPPAELLQIAMRVPSFATNPDNWEVEIVLEVCPLAALPRGEARRVETDPPIAVFHTEDGEVFAIDDTCTHQDASLADGWVEGCEVECPLHASRFDLRTGAVDAPPAKLPVRTHEVVVTNDVINVVLNTAQPNLPPGVTTGAAGKADQ
jgi:3-phenylpropionate/trans-cinnamate dioxygenase ferredoxin component